MSAWYIFSALGFYPVTPGIAEYVIGSSKYSKATLYLSNGKRFVISATGVSITHRYIRSATLNGKPMNSFLLKRFRQYEWVRLVFHMGASPNFAWPENIGAAKTKGAF